tara:strand:- start:435 stop:668 length:234 start_codon:yes stop_codon:yes gene_type:complete
MPVHGRHGCRFLKWIVFIIVALSPLFANALPTPPGKCYQTMRRSLQRLSFKNKPYQISSIEYFFGDIWLDRYNRLLA